MLVSILHSTRRYGLSGTAGGEDWSAEGEDWQSAGGEDWSAGGEDWIDRVLGVRIGVLRVRFGRVLGVRIGVLEVRIGLAECWG